MTKIKNKHHSHKIKIINEMSESLKKKVQKRKSIGLAIHSLIVSRTATATNDPKLIDDYTEAINELYQKSYVPLTNIIKEYMARIKELKHISKDEQRFCDKYRKMIGQDGTIRYRDFQTNEVKHGKICGAMITYGDGFIPVKCLDRPKKSFWQRVLHNNDTEQCTDYIRLTELLPLE